MFIARSRPERTPICLPLVLALMGQTAAMAGPATLEPPTADVLAEANAIVESMKGAPRGPYTRLRWYCDDGTVHPPRPYPCAERGGGHQHAEYSAERRRLAELGWSVGTILTATTWEELWDETRRHQRLRELSLERYLVEIDDGWVLHRARFYRGRVQVEDEEESGYRLLSQLLSHPDWVARNYLLVRESGRALHHGNGSDRTRTVRRLAKEVADGDSSFETIRIKIHTAPDIGDAPRTTAWLEEARRRDGDPQVLGIAERLVEELESLFGATSRSDRFERLQNDPAHTELAPLLADIFEVSASVRLERLARVMQLVRDAVSARSVELTDKVALLDLSSDAESELIQTAFELMRKENATRYELLDLARHLTVAAFGAGFLSARERDELIRPLADFRARSSVTAADYLRVARGLERAGTWGLGTVRYTFAEPLVRYSALEPKAEGFVDDLLRGSALLPLAQVASALARDAENLAGLSHVVFGSRVGGLVGLNPGAAVGRLRLVSEEELLRRARLDEEEIVVLPRTVSELTPVAGIITLAEGSVLSHVQLLARNLGIPNVSATPDLAPVLERFRGLEVVLAVGSDGSVVLERADRLPQALGAGLRQTPELASAVPANKLEVPTPDLSVRRPLRLSELHAGLSGKVVGPKAANVGELARLFPGRVPPALALPFGIFAEHALAGAEAPKVRLDRACERFREGEIDDLTLAAEVEAVRTAISALRLSGARREQLLALMWEVFGPPGTYGVFVRSDTNLEDLPSFTGAGLNKTIPHVVDMEKILAAIPEVWSSPFTARAVAWRERALTRPQEVYPSVLLMQSVPVAKSGVLVTADLVTGGQGLTVATAWGVGGAVEGESAETLVLRPGGSYSVVAEAKATHARRLKTSGGVEWIPAQAGSVLTDNERRALRTLADEVRSRLEPVPGPGGRPLAWDIEFGFLDGRLYLFQIRPLIERGSTRADQIVQALGGIRGVSRGRVALDAVVGATVAAGAPGH